MDIQFINCGEWGIEAKGFQMYIKRLEKHAPEAEGVLNVIFVNDDYIQSLNKQYRKKDQPTDVLSFSYLGSSDYKETELIGEIYVSVETARRNIKVLQVPGTTMEPAYGLDDELSKLFVHGFLHVFGHDHESEKDFEKMNKIEREVLG